MIYLSYLVFIAIIIFLYIANDINLRRRDVAQARLLWFAAARQTDPEIGNDVEKFSRLTAEKPTPDLLAARDFYLKNYGKLASCCRRHSMVAAILRVHLNEEKFL